MRFVTGLFAGLITAAILAIASDKAVITLPMWLRFSVVILAIILFVATLFLVF